MCIFSSMLLLLCPGFFWEVVDGGRWWLPAGQWLEGGVLCVVPLSVSVLVCKKLVFWGAVCGQSWIWSAERSFSLWISSSA
jgi:hypothetical protein